MIHELLVQDERLDMHMHTSISMSVNFVVCIMWRTNEFAHAVAVLLLCYVAGVLLGGSVVAAS